MSAALVSSSVSCARVLIVSKDPELRQRVRSQLRHSATAIFEARGGAEALEQLEQEPYDLLVLDPALPDVHPADVAALARRLHPRLQIATVQDLQSEHTPPVMAGPEDSPIGVGTAGETVASAFGPTAPDFTEVAEPATEPLPGMIGRCAAMQEIYRLARLVAPRDTTVLITGETGTGKELVARAIHQLSQRAAGPFVVVNCAAIPETLLEAELFGHVRGAFTGAVQSRLGRIHAAHGGTLFLDEAGELPLAMQAKLLRFLQCGEVQRLGSPDVFRVDVRVIAATNADLAELVARRQFRADLYWRLAVFPLPLPPLRDRREDIVPLAETFLERLCSEAGLPPKRLSAGARALLQRYSWPGNVRELQHAIERAFILAENRREITADLFRLHGNMASV